MKHWTEPNGIFLIKIPIEWQYLNSAVEGKKDVPPYSFQPLYSAVGCFQISCYPIKEQSPKLAEAYPNGVPHHSWQTSREDDKEFCVHFFFGALGDQALIGKYIYDAKLDGDERIKEQLYFVNKAINSIVIVPENDRKLAADLDKLDRFTGSLAASYDLLDSAIDSGSYVEVIALSANHIDAFLRLGIVIAIQLKDSTDDIPTKYLFQEDGEKGIMEQKIFDDALKYNVISDADYSELKKLYALRNRVIHRYIISDIKTRDLPHIAIRYLEASEKFRLILSALEVTQKSSDYGVYGKKFGQACASDDNAIKRLYAGVNEKHLMGKFTRKISDE